MKKNVLTQILHYKSAALAIIAFLLVQNTNAQIVDVDFNTGTFQWINLKGDGIINGGACGLEVTGILSNGSNQLPIGPNNRMDQDNVCGNASTILDNFTLPGVDLTTPLDINLAAFEDDCGSRFLFNKNNSANNNSTCFPCTNSGCGLNGDEDLGYTTVPISINFLTHPPETYFPFSITTDAQVDGSATYIVTYQVKYRFPPLTGPTLSGIPSTGALICGDRVITLQANGLSAINNKTGVKYYWEYKLPNDTTWYSLDSTTAAIQGDSILFNARIKIPQLDTITINTAVAFRYKAGNINGQSPYSATTSYDFLPAAPRILAFTAHPSCQQVQNGSIQLDSVHNALNNWQYFLKSGFNNTFCDPNIPNSCLTSVVSNGPFSDPFFQIDNIDTGDYTLLIANPAGVHGTCFTHYNIRIDSLPIVQLYIDSSANITCPNGTNGKIFAHCANATPSYAFELQPNLGNILQLNDVVQISNLPAGTYSLKVKDVCNTYTIPLTVTLTQPTAISSSILGVNLTCNNPGDGIITTTLAGGSGAYNYYLSNIFGTLLDSSIAAANLWNKQNVPQGTYIVQTQDVLLSNCAYLRDTVNLQGTSPISLTDSVIATQCNGGADGAIYLQATGNSTGYTFTLINTSSNTAISNTTGAFTGLSAGNFTAIAKRNIATCLDSVISNTIVVTQPSPVQVSLSSQNVSCNNANNGWVHAQASGGTAPYTYAWEFSIGSGFSITSGTTDSLKNLFPAQYRAIITDAHNCSITSTPVNVAEPNALTMSSVSSTNPACIGTTGDIIINAQGGTLPYTFGYSIDNGATWATYTPGAASLSANTYLVKVQDAQACQIIYPSSITLTQPTQALSFTSTYSNYNGSVISCNGAADASITLQASGGNGSGFSGYFYSLNALPFATTNAFSNLAAGTYTMQVKDGRNCIVSQIVNLQSPQALVLSVSNKSTLFCAADSSGTFTLGTTGGTLPYSYSTNNASYQASNIFTNTTAGTYTLQVKDANNCIATIIDSITSTQAPIVLNTVAQNITCYGANNGAITVNATGGAGNFTYNWSGASTATTNTISNVSPGIYTIKVTDNVACKLYKTFIISQPDTALHAQLMVLPICEGATTGKVLIHALGGTKPFLYSLNNGTSYQADSNFNNLAQGIYTMAIKDSNNCIFTNTVSIAPQQLNLKQNFIAANKQYLNDSIYLIDISVPAPDSISWAYDANTTVLDSSWQQPIVAYADTGNYLITQTVYFSNCAYTITKNMHIGLPADTTTTASTTGITGFTVSPNPNNGNFTINITLSKNYPRLIVRVNKVDGELLYNSSTENITQLQKNITLTNVTPGTYIIRAIVADDLKQQIIVVQ